MLLTRKNQVSGPELKKFRITEDRQTGIWGIKIGYCSGCNDPVIISHLDTGVIVSKLAYDLEEYEKMLESIRRYRDFWSFIGNWLVDKVMHKKMDNRG